MGPVGRDGGGLQAGQLPVLARCDVHGYAKLRAVATAATARRGFPTSGTSDSANRDRARVQPRALHHVYGAEGMAAHARRLSRKWRASTGEIGGALYALEKF